VIFNQLVEIASDLPRHQDNIDKKLKISRAKYNAATVARRMPEVRIPFDSAGRITSGQLPRRTIRHALMRRIDVPWLIRNQTAITNPSPPGQATVILSWIDFRASIMCAIVRALGWPIIEGHPPDRLAKQRCRIARVATRFVKGRVFDRENAFGLAIPADGIQRCQLGNAVGQRF
jgi:hypothetical protein